MTEARYTQEHHTQVQPCAIERAERLPDCPRPCQPGRERSRETRMAPPYAVVAPLHHMTPNRNEFLSQNHICDDGEQRVNDP